MGEHEWGKHFLASVIGFALGIGIQQSTCNYIENQNIHPDYVKPKNAVVITQDLNEDGYKETVLEYTTQSGQKKKVDLSFSNLEKIAEDRDN